MKSNKKLMSRRLPAEWEPQSAIQFTFPHEDSDWLPMLNTVIPCFVKLIETVTKYQKVLVVCKNKEKTKELLRGCVQENLILVALPSNDTWARDHAAITVFDDDKPVLLDFVFNGWGLKFAADKDNLITQGLFDKGIFKTKKIQKGGIVLEGGGIESDGQGTLMTTSECLLSPNRNPHLNKVQLEKELQSLFGVDRVLWVRLAGVWSGHSRHVALRRSAGGRRPAQHFAARSGHAGRHPRGPEPRPRRGAGAGAWGPVRCQGRAEADHPDSLLQ